MIGWACRIIQAAVIPAHISTLQRVAGVVNDASTLRGWLAAWKLAHDVLGDPWVGDMDPRLRLARIGTQRLAPPPRPRKCAHLQDTVQIVTWAFSTNSRRWTLWAGLAAVAYAFGFRVPSELLGQWGVGPNPARFVLLSSREVRYGPYKRKAQHHANFTTRSCLCGSASAVCPHLWVEAFHELGLVSAEYMSQSEFTKMLQVCVSDSLPRGPPGEERLWTSLVFRRGSAADILKQHGVKAMMKHGEWLSEASAAAYATADEIASSKLHAACTAMLDLSDDE